MVRLIVILMLGLSGLSWPGVLAIGSTDRADVCAASGCDHTRLRVTCCGEIIEESYCPMSDGPCRCGVSENPDPEKTPQAPLPRPERDQIVAVVDLAGHHSVDSGGDDRQIAFGVRPVAWWSGLTHNEIRSLLGVWRT